MQSSKLFTPSRFCWVGFAVFCCLWFPVTAKSQSNPVNPDWVVPVPWPGAQWTIGEYLFYQLGVPTENPSVRELLETIAQSVGSPFPSNFVTDLQLASELNSISRDYLQPILDDQDAIARALDPDTPGDFAQSLVLALYDDHYETPLLYKLRNLTYTTSSELRVHDEEANEYLASMLNQLRGMESYADGAAYSVTSALYRIQHQNQEYWDQDPGSTVSEGEHQAQQQVDETNAYVDDLIDETEPYEPTEEETQPPEDNPVGSDDDTTQLTNVSTPTHSTNLKLLNQQTVTIGSSRPIRLNFPTMEYDMSGDGVADFVSTAGSVCRAFWTALFPSLVSCFGIAVCNRHAKCSCMLVSAQSVKALISMLAQCLGVGDGSTFNHSSSILC